MQVRSTLYNWLTHLHINMWQYVNTTSRAFSKGKTLQSPRWFYQTFDIRIIREGEKTTSQIVAETSGQSQSNISNHLSCLLDCGLVKNRRQGKNIFYRLGDKKVSKLLEQHSNIFNYSITMCQSKLLWMSKPNLLKAWK